MGSFYPSAVAKKTLNDLLKLGSIGLVDLRMLFTTDRQRFALLVRR